jgi:hypothetical protein
MGPHPEISSYIYSGGSVEENEAQENGGARLGKFLKEHDDKCRLDEIF